MLSVSVDGLDIVQAALEDYPAALVEALADKANALAESLVDKVKFEKLDGEVLNARSGALGASIEAEVNGDSERISATIGSFGGIKYAAIQEYGGQTGAHEIVPDKAQVLAFLVGGAIHFARKVDHPGSVIPERSYLRSSLQDMQGDIENALAATAAETWEKS
jgi:phage gpG-like protein